MNKADRKDMMWMSSMEGDRFYPDRDSWGVHCLLPTSVIHVPAIGGVCWIGWGDGRGVLICFILLLNGYYAKLGRGRMRLWELTQLLTFLLGVS